MSKKTVVLEYEVASERFNVRFNCGGSLDMTVSSDHTIRISSNSKDFPYVSYRSPRDELARQMSQKSCGGGNFVYNMGNATYAKPIKDSQTSKKHKVTYTHHWFWGWRKQDENQA